MIFKNEDIKAEMKVLITKNNQFIVNFNANPIEMLFMITSSLDALYQLMEEELIDKDVVMLKNFIVDKITELTQINDADERSERINTLFDDIEKLFKMIIEGE